MKIKGTRFEINDVELDISDSIESASAAFNSKIEKGHIEVFEETKKGKVRWLIYQHSSQPNLYLLGTVLFEKEQTGWKFWSKKEEVRRKKTQDKLLKSWNIKTGNSAGMSIQNMYDPKGGFSAISVNKA
ncbi:MAG: hypothetical protein CML13_02135 [Puniceicoccaceae bacterium]|nr:hypothetical protein [Puniceicoccaceae bacterium]|tara:strand:+ start:538 stop:924 length:387 start_codon:yes stop_codon:yes gene_type:complete